MKSLKYLCKVLFFGVDVSVLDLDNLQNKVF